MHERTRRAVARLLFVLVCALPTLAVFFFVLITFTPWFADYRRACLERELSLRIGLAVEIDAVEYYIKNFVWGGLQRTDTETPYAYGVYGTPNWKVNRDDRHPKTRRPPARH